MTKRSAIPAVAILTAALAGTWVLAQDAKDRGGQGKGGQDQKTSAAESAQKFLKEHNKNNDGSLTRDELPAGMRDGFADVDGNSDGKLSAEELKQHAERMVLVPVPVPVEITSVYLIEAATDAPSREDLNRAYDMLRKADSNNDGQLSQDEVKAAREQAIQGRVDAIFKRCDKNNDGKIGKDECPAELTGLFNRTDKDNNGTITKEELKQCCMKAADEVGKSGPGSNQTPGKK